MQLNPDFEIIRVADDWLAVPVGETTEAFGGIVALSEPSAFLLEKLKAPKTPEELVDYLVGEYDVKRIEAKADVDAFIDTIVSIGLVLKSNEYEGYDR